MTATPDGGGASDDGTHPAPTAVPDGGGGASNEGGHPGRYFPGGPRLAFFALLVAILAGAWQTVRPLVGPLLLATAAASLTHPLYLRAAQRLGRRLAAALCTSVLLLLVLIPLAVLIAVGAARLAQEVTQLPSQLARAEEVVRTLADRLGRFGPRVAEAIDRMTAAASDTMPAVAQRLGSGAAEVGGAAVGAFIGIFVFTIALYYLFVDGVEWRERLIRVLPIDERFTRALLHRFTRVSLAVLIGNLGGALLHGVLSFAGYALFGVSAPLTWAVVTAIASFIPVFGTGLVWVPLSIGLALSSGVLRGLALFGFCALIVGGADNVAKPFLMRGGLGLHPLAVFVAVIGGVAAFGFIGVLLGPLLFALAVVALELYENGQA